MKIQFPVLEQILGLDDVTIQSVFNEDMDFFNLKKIKDSKNPHIRTKEPPGWNRNMAFKYPKYNNLFFENFNN